MKTVDDLTNDELKTACKQMTSKALATRVSIYRQFKIHKKLATKCMEELINRQNNGDGFDYDKYISALLNSYPQTKQEINTTGLVSQTILEEMKRYGKR